MPVKDPFEQSSSIFYYHRQMIAYHGKDSTLALGWRDEESQLIRFKTLTGIGDMNGKTILDAGCGYADLYPYLIGLYPDLEHYYGVEQIPELYDEAVKRYQRSASVSIITGNFISRQLPKADYALASGSLNYFTEDSDGIYKAIDKLFADCTIGFAFNFLREMPVKGILTAHDPERILKHCQTLTNNIKVIDDYADEDITVYLYH